MDSNELQYSQQLQASTDLMGYISRIDNYDMLHVSKYLCECLGMEENGYKGMKCYEVIHNRKTPCHFCNNDRLKQGEHYKWYAYNALMDAHLVVRDTLIPHEEFGEVRCEICYEITNEVAQIAHLQTSSSVDKAVLACAKTLIDSKDLDSTIHQLLQTLATYFAAESAYIFELFAVTSTLRKTYEYVADKEAEASQVTQIPYQKIFSWLDAMHNDDILYINTKEHTLKEDSNRQRLLREQNATAIILVPLRKNGKIIGIMGVNNPTENLNDVSLTKTVSGFVTNDLEKREMIKELEYLGYTDKLTGVKNRNCYLNKIEKVKQSKVGGVGILFADINGLKKANDNLGHEYGDTLIKWSAKFLEKNIPASVYRIGGDEFVVIADDMTKEEFERCVESINQLIDEMPLIHMSIGTTYEEGTIDIEKQIVRTDEAMYANKQEYYLSKSYNHMNLDTECVQLREEILKLREELEVSR